MPVESTYDNHAIDFLSKQYNAQAWSLLVLLRNVPPTVKSRRSLPVSQTFPRQLQTRDTIRSSSPVKRVKAPTFAANTRELAEQSS